MAAHVGSIQVASKRILTIENSGDSSNRTVYIFKHNGTDKKKLINSVGARVKGNYVYCVRFDEKNWRNTRYRVYRYNLNGKHKKQITGWKKKYPKKYDYFSYY